jgi:hypothetical protein
MNIARGFFAICLSVLLIVAGQGTAFARAHAPSERQVILCTGHGAIVIHVDSEGHPTTAPELCADCAQALLGLEVQPAPTLAHLVSFEPAWLDFSVHQNSGALARSGSARGPPIL